MTRRTLEAIVVELRPKQWTKNLLLFAGLIFSRHALELDRVARAFLAFAFFCCLSGVVYLINDLADLEADRLHPTKRTRPLAAGELSPRIAKLVAGILALGGLAGSFALNVRFGILATFYLVLMLGYSWRLKHLVILDILIVAIGFVMRAVGGIWAIEYADEHIRITPWFLTCVLFLALFIAICKRRHELILLSDSATNHRPVLEDYSQPLLDQMVSVATAATVISYALYVTLGVRPETVRNHEYMIFTLPFVLYGIFRYLYLVYKRREGGAPEALLLQDGPLLVNLALWLLAMFWVFYA
ncbi:MAG: decaprenyl-phosphate phosphoribosyltransferase [Candidatus Sumerlaeaceae bacterium]|nr:decaprenyl-phosphate phosphoribosyltransferase [Candidatus Sumerlaeaceae bacterium]